MRFVQLATHNPADSGGIADFCWLISLRHEQGITRGNYTHASDVLIQCTRISALAAAGEGFK
jgi:hypothetical protein